MFFCFAPKSWIWGRSEKNLRDSFKRVVRQRETFCHSHNFCQNHICVSNNVIFNESYHSLKRTLCQNETYCHSELKFLVKNHMYLYLLHSFTVSYYSFKKSVVWFQAHIFCQNLICLTNVQIDHGFNWGVTNICNKCSFWGGPTK